MNHDPGLSRAVPGVAVCALATGLFAGSALAISGPVFPLPFPTPSGSSFVGNGAAGSAGGRTFVYQIVMPTSYTRVYWGHSGGSAIVASTRNDPNDTLTFNVQESNLASGVARWTGTSQIEVSDGGGFVTYTVPTRLTVTCTGTTPVVMQTGASAGALNSGALANISGRSTFSANLLFEARNPLTNTYQPIRDMFNALPTNPASGVIASFSGAFYYRLGAACSGDGDGNGVVNFSDITAILLNFNTSYLPTPGTGPGDADGNGVVNFADITAVILTFQNVCP